MLHLISFVKASEILIFFFFNTAKSSADVNMSCMSSHYSGCRRTCLKYCHQLNFESLQQGPRFPISLETKWAACSSNDYRTSALMVDGLWFFLSQGKWRENMNSFSRSRLGTWVTSRCYLFLAWGIAANDCNKQESHWLSISSCT